jgi:hypothetical protein
MTPGKTGGIRNVVVVKAPQTPVPEHFGSDTKYLKYRCLRGSPILNRLPTTGFTRGHNYNAPSEQDFPINRPLSLNSQDFNLRQEGQLTS